MEKRLMTRKEKTKAILDLNIYTKEDLKGWTDEEIEETYYEEVEETDEDRLEKQILKKKTKGIARKPKTIDLMRLKNNLCKINFSRYSKWRYGKSTLGLIEWIDPPPDKGQERFVNFYDLISYKSMLVQIRYIDSWETIMKLPAKTFKKIYSKAERSLVYGLTQFIEDLKEFKLLRPEEVHILETERVKLLPQKT
jgi:hypothetical protein